MRNTDTSMFALVTLSRIPFSALDTIYHFAHSIFHFFAYALPYGKRWPSKITLTQKIWKVFSGSGNQNGFERGVSWPSWISRAFFGFNVW